VSEYAFSSQQIEKDWRSLIDLGPRFPGTPAEVQARELIVSRLEGLADRVEEHAFTYLGWSLLEPPRLAIQAPSHYDLPCEAFIYCSPTPPGGLRGRLQFVGTHRVIGLFDWVKFAVVDDDGQVLAYVSGRPNGPAQPQPLNRDSAPQPHFIVGQTGLAMLTSLLQRGLPVEVEGSIRCRLEPGARTKNVIAAFNAGLTSGRIGLCAHYDSMYGCPGANDNAGGVAALLALARFAGQAAPQLPLDLFFFSGEEWDLAGSRAFVTDRLAGQAPGRYRMLINLDGISEGYALDVGASPESFEAELRRVIDRFSHPRAVSKTYNFPPYLGSDHVPFYEAGVPVCAISFGDSIKYHLSWDTYCPEGVDNILYVTELTRHVIEAFTGREDSWPRVAR